MTKKLWMASLFVMLLLLAACGKSDNDNAAEPAADQEPVVETAVEESASLKLLENEAVGDYLADSEGMTLYYFKKDEAGKSNCSGECVEKWPPFTAKQFDVPAGWNKEDFATIKREDNGMEQVTYKGFPLYYFVKDQKEGDTNGQGVKDVWFIVNSETAFK
ncbi:hypothetical protein QYG89_03875 [Bacillus sp. B190/17]|uniref:Lipoprotein n=1 Tax=Bacillus lumedeiriae TaxID=3058829 RepID=A0ABW8I5Q0_9BACI